MTPQQQELVDKASAHLATDERIEALWLAGSLGRGAGDEFSDVDLLACCAGGARDAVAADLRQSIASIAEPLLVNALFEGRVINVVTQGWQRFDVTLVEPEALARYDPGRLVTLYNRTGLQPSGDTPDAYRATSQTVLPIVREFLRVLGLSGVGMGRGEYILMMQGVELLRGLTVNLMLEENGVSPADRGGALKRFPFLTEEQRAELLAVPPLSPTPESILAANSVLAHNFLPRARRLVEHVGGEWPAALEAGTLAHLDQLGIGIR